MEWSNQSKYNSFNSYKGLTYYENYQGIVAWLRNEGALPVPVECSLDPIMRCNQKCYFCNSQHYLREANFPRAEGLTWGEMYQLILFLGKWGVKGLCFGGGGESTLNSDMIGISSLARQRMDVSLVTNGSMLNDVFLQEEVIDYRWLGISFNAANKEQYKAIHGVDMFDLVVKNIKDVIKRRYERNGKVDIALKLLVLPENADSIYDACVLAKSLGVQDFHVRPVDLERKDYKLAHRLNLDMVQIERSFAQCHAEETDAFKVYTVVHKYDEHFHVKHDFKRCLASPLVLQVCTDGNCYVCVDHRMEDRFKLGKMENIKEWWGSDKHRELVQSINPEMECSRCTWSEYQRQITEVVIEDKMCRNFP